jgi:hypothetical protein
MRGTRRFKVKGKLAPRYVGPFKIIIRKGEVAYQLELSPQLADVHDVFHVSQLKKCLRVPDEQLPMKELDLGGDLTYSERPIKIFDMAEHMTRSKVINVIPHSEIAEMKPPYVFPGCFIHTYSNHMINRCHIQ